jgi:ABC-type lipoprotein export system ATPase subunit
MLLEFDAVAKRYMRHAREIVAVDGASFDVEAGESLCVLGSARSGKTTLLRLAAGIEMPDDGEVRFAGRATSAMSRREKELMFRRDVGCVWETAGPGHLDVVEFVSWPLISTNMRVRRATARAREVLRRVGADGCAGARLGDLSGSELLRVSFAQALIREPRLLLADEPSKTLDPIDRGEIIDLLFAVTQDVGVSVLMTAGDATGALPSARLASLDRGRLLMRPRPQADVLPFQPRRAAHG